MGVRVVVPVDPSNRDTLGVVVTVAMAGVSEATTDTLSRDPVGKGLPLPTCE